MIDAKFLVLQKWKECDYKNLIEALDPINCLVAEFSSEILNREVSMPSVSDTGTLGRALLLDTLALFPRSF